MENLLLIANAVIILILLAMTWWYAHSTSSLLHRSQDQVAGIQRQAVAKIEELHASYTRILREIEERQQAEERLEESEARFAAFMRHLPGMAEMRDTNGRYLFVNETWEKIFARNPDDCRGKTLEEVWPPDFASRFMELDRRIIEDGHPLENIENLDQNGRTYSWLITRFPILNQENQAVMVGAIGIDITARRQAEEALKASEQKLRSLTAQLLSAQEIERKRLAAELHDELGHSLLTLKLRLESLEEQLQPQQVSLKKEVQKILRFISQTIGEVRRLYLDLIPGDLEDLGLTAALHSLIEDFIDLQKQISWEVEVDNLDGLFPLPIQTAIYRVVQEALTNIGKHAKPTQVALSISKDQDKVLFTIKDNGGGFDANKVFAQKKTLGLLSMEERVKILGGTFNLWSQKNQGTKISFSIPLSKEGYLL
ncbi:MAG: PAS domain-containing protein [Deltaproteobacteria bacterium]|nr:PAS domain-containing protein [Deltaproteobacteria bacterium]